MICDLCHKNEAVVFVRDVISPSCTKELYLCAECAKKRGISTGDNSESPSIGGFLKDLIEKKQGIKNKVCSVCGKRFSDILKEKKAGCPECYSAFRDEIQDILKGMGITRPFTGSLPNSIEGFKSSLTDRVKIQELLEEAIKNENYEQAAVYRDQLKLLETEAVEEFLDE